MKKIKLQSLKAFFRFSIVLMFCLTSIIHGRSQLRRQRNNIPAITTSWIGDSKTYTIKNNHLGIYPFFNIYDEAHLNRFKLSDDAIPFRSDSQKNVLGSKLKEQINELLKELKAKKRTFTHFVVLQSKDYNFDKNWGLLVLKFKDYPFVLKLFIETPEGIVAPFNKGIEPVFFFYMGSGVSRHLTGFTRIKNREIVLNLIKNNPELAGKIEIPNKWFWIPQDSRMITIRSTDLADDPLETTIPGTYVVIADYVESARPFSLSESHDRIQALDLCNKLELMIDPHIKNFMIDKNTQNLVIVDTEHFPTATGLYSHGPFNSYLHWYFHLVSKCIKDMLLLTKRERRARQRNLPVRALGVEKMC